MGSSPQVVDWNSDGHRDLVAGDREGYFNCFLANPDTLIAYKKMRLANGDTIDVGSNSEPQVTDWNRDGRKDLILGTEGGNVRLYLNVGTEQAPAFQNYSLIYAGGSAMNWYRGTPRVVDLDQDGKRDLVIGSDYGCYLYYYRNIGSDTNPTFAAARETLRTVTGTLIQPGGTYTYGPRAAFCDWNNDGTVDFLLSGYDGWIELYLGVGRDAGVSAIMAPSGTLDSGTVVTPACTAANYGPLTLSYTVRMKIGTGYNYTATVTNQAPYGRAYLTFPAWTAQPRGSIAVSCSTELTGDMYPADDRRTGTVTVVIRDVGVRRIVWPAATADSGFQVTPQCSVYNYGNTTVAYTVRMKIGTTYNQASMVYGHAPGTGQLISFLPWTPGPRGSYAVSCSTELGDMFPVNDRATSSVLVQVKDATPVAIVAPAGAIDSGTVVTPACTLANLGNATVDYRVRLRVGSVYNQTAQVTGHAPGAPVYVTFPDWTALARGSHVVTCTTELANDALAGNNRRTGAVDVAVRDVVLRSIVAPGGIVDSGAAVTPACSVYNAGTAAASYDVRMRVGSTYDQTVAVTAQPAGTAQYITFPAWTAAPLGNSAVSCSTMMAGDMQTGNDRRTGTVRVIHGWTPGWLELAKIPLSPSGVAVKDGGWLAAMAGAERIYSAKGNKRGDFHVYDVATSDWTQKSAIPNGIEGKPPSKGACGASDGNEYIYALKGNNTLGFWQYSVTRDSWFQLADLPRGLNGRRVKGGSDLAFVPPNYVYCMKGYNNEFYRYDVTQDSWQTLDPVPAPRLDIGSFLVYDGNQALYVHRSKEHNLFKFDVAGSRWAATYPGMPYMNRAGSSKKSKDGGSAAFDEAAIFAFKGGNTQEWWRFSTASNTWNELETIPALGSDGLKKKVKAGGDVVGIGNGAFFAQKGNKSVQFWRYVYDAALLGESPAPTVLGSNAASGASRALEVSPNPLRSGFATVRLGGPAAQWSSGPARISVLDISGRILQSAVCNLKAEMALDLRGLSAGVYLLQLRSGAFDATTRLVIE